MYGGYTEYVQYCGTFFQDSFETYETFLQRKFTEFERKADF